jgi:phosphoribosylglycinamide formyltransferase-1
VSTSSCRLGILGSGRGSNFAAIHDFLREPAPYEIAIVLSDQPESGILQLARSRGVAHQYVAPGKFRTKLDEPSERAYVAALQTARVDWVVLAGFMRILQGNFLQAFPQRVVNIHPALLPAFPGLEAWKQALDYGVKFTGCTVHLVDQGVDTGPILAQQVVAILPGDTPETLHARIQAAEHELYPVTLASLARNRLVVQGRTAMIESPKEMV